MYYKGRGVPNDDAEALRLYRKAADQGYTQAQIVLGDMYRNGQGVPRNYAEAVRWYGNVVASCFARTRGGPLARWTSVAVILLGLVVVLVPKRRWGRAAWLSSALCSASCAAALV